MIINFICLSINSLKSAGITILIFPSPIIAPVVYIIMFEVMTL